MACNPTNGAYVKYKSKNAVVMFRNLYHYEQYGWYHTCETVTVDNGPLPTCAPWFEATTSQLDECNLSFELGVPTEVDVLVGTPMSWNSYTGSGVGIKKDEYPTYSADGKWYLTIYWRR